MIFDCLKLLIVLLGGYIDVGLLYIVYRYFFRLVLNYISMLCYYSGKFR